MTNREIPNIWEQAARYFEDPNWYDRAAHIPGPKSPLKRLVRRAALRALRWTHRSDG